LERLFKKRGVQKYFFRFGKTQAQDKSGCGFFSRFVSNNKNFPGHLSERSGKNPGFKIVVFYQISG
jgi:hypothetical protein